MTFTALFIVIDWQAGFSPAGCRFAFGLWLVMLAAATLWCGWTVRRTLTPVAMAVLAERVTPGSRNHLVNAVQLAQTGNETFAEKIIEEGAEALPDLRMPARRLVPHLFLRWSVLAFAASATVLLALFLLAPQASLHAAARLLNPGGARTPAGLTRIVQVVPGDIDLVRGESLNVIAKTAGLTPARSVLQWRRGEDGEPRSREMNFKSDKGGEGRFEIELTDVRTPIRYRVTAGQAVSDWHQVSIRPLPSVKSWRAQVRPPEYTGVENYTITHDMEGESASEVPAGSEVKLTLNFSEEIASLKVLQEEREITGEEIEPADKTIETEFTLPPRESAPIDLEFMDGNGDDNHKRLSLQIREDQKPRVVITEPEDGLEVEPRDEAAVMFRAEDDYGVTSVELERLTSDGQEELLGRAAPVGETLEFQGGFKLDMASLEVRPGEEVILRARAADNCPYYTERFGYSDILRLVVAESTKEKTAEMESASREKLRDELQALIQMQRENLQATVASKDLAVSGEFPAQSRVRNHYRQQLEIEKEIERLLTADLLFGQPLTRLRELREKQAVQAVRLLRDALRDFSGFEIEDLATMLVRTVAVQRSILATLSGLFEAQEHEREYRSRSELLRNLEKLAEEQLLNLQATLALQKGRAVDSPARLSRVQDRLARDLQAFNSRALELLRQDMEEDFMSAVREVLDLFDRKDLYVLMITAAEFLEHDSLREAADSEEACLRLLLRGLDTLNLWRGEFARRRLEEAAEALEELGEGLRELEDKQGRIVEVTRDLAERKSFDEEARRKLGEMDREQEAMGEMVEQLAQDFYQFPELPVSHELNSRMLEIYEDVQQAAGSEHEPAIEIAVQKEDALLDSIRDTLERVEDVEMWLPDEPDNIAWKMESFDTDEFPDIPLVPLPDELEDIVGDLLEQAQEIDEQAQHATGNQIIADMEMGWDIMDGPMPVFSAKGKSGNVPPHENEMTGRSGAGREGQAAGELVEDRVKGLEGRETEVRRTPEPLQAGMVEEEEDSTLTARSTGGGKLGGLSETIGMFGEAPRRDLHLDPAVHGRDRLRRETEALYSQVRLLHLPAESAGLAAADLRRSINEIPDLAHFRSLHRRVIRRLQQTQVELRDGTVIEMDSPRGSITAGAMVQDFDLHQVSEEYRSELIDYYKTLGGE